MTKRFEKFDYSFEIRFKELSITKLGGVVATFDVSYMFPTGMTIEKNILWSKQRIKSQGSSKTISLALDEKYEVRSDAE